MKIQSKRLFINNLPNNISQEDLQEKFKHYGNVNSIEIKQRKNVGINQTLHFAYVHIHLEENDLHSCINELSSKKWKGHHLEVQEAKENFMDRLKREREEQKLNGTTKAVENIESTNNINNIFVNNKKYHSSSSESSETEQEDSCIISSSTNLSRKRKIRDEEENEGDKIIKKSDIIKNEPNKGSSLEIVKQNDLKKVGTKEMEANKKRLQSMAQMSKDYKQQKALIRNALANIDAKPKNKIIFYNDEDEVGNIIDKKSQNAETKMSRKLQLFQVDEGDDENYNFEIKAQFEGEKGQKLMKLQSKFKNDKRFNLDARFLEDEFENEEGGESEDKEITLDEEKLKQFEILEEVLGKKISKKSKSIESKIPEMMIRFDPTNPEHSKYEIKERVKQVEKKKKTKETERKSIDSKPVEDAPPPEVSKDTFYKVSEELKIALQENEGFSLAQMFSENIEDVQNEELSKEETVTINKQTNTFLNEKNPFRYDSSSDSEEEAEPSMKKSKMSTVSHQQRQESTRLWKESFFFKPDDYRLQEGLDFLRRLASEQQDDFHKVRRNLKEIVRAKVKNNQRNNRPFKRKLGGKKRIRVKRALKR